MQDFLPMITGAISGAAAAGLFKGPVQTLQDYWYIHFGHHASEQAEMLRVQQEAKISDLRDRTLNHVSKIEPENIQKPKLQILGPALEATNFYIEEESLREMFAKLMASSMDKSKTETLHPAFVEIIKQMTPLDAANLRSVYYGNQVVGRILTYNKTGGFSITTDNIYVNNNVDASHDSMATSIDNLSRLNLVEVTYDRYLIAEDAYDEIYKSQQYKNAEALGNSFKQIQESGAEFPDVPLDIVDAIRSQILEHDRIELSKGKIEPTMLGTRFCEICLSE
jgi:hypothetical protein